VTDPPPFVTRYLALGWDRHRFAREVGFVPRTIENWEQRRRNPSPLQYQKMARVFGCSVRDLIDPDAPRYDTPTNPQRRPWGVHQPPLGDAADRFNAARTR
jgi:transcriptional regulator with XRE-family HTH domain